MLKKIGLSSFFALAKASSPMDTNPRGSPDAVTDTGIFHIANDSFDILLSFLLVSFEILFSFLHFPHKKQKSPDMLRKNTSGGSYGIHLDKNLQYSQTRTATEG